MIAHLALTAAFAEPERFSRRGVAEVSAQQAAVIAKQRLELVTELATAIAVPVAIDHRLDIGGERGQRPVGNLLRMGLDGKPPLVCRLRRTPLSLHAGDVGFHGIVSSVSPCRFSSWKGFLPAASQPR